VIGGGERADGCRLVGASGDNVGVARDLALSWSRRTPVVDLEAPSIVTAAPSSSAAHRCPITLLKSSPPQPLYGSPPSQPPFTGHRHPRPLHQSLAHQPTS
jgi:hypothetical protein